MPTDSWYYARAGQQSGPVPHSTLMQMYSSGQLQPADLVWTDGMANWLPAGQVLAPAGAAPAPAPYPTPQSVPYEAPGYYAPGQSPQIGYYTPGAYAPEYAGFWLRFVAHIIDSLVTGIGGAIIGGCIGGIIGGTAGANGANPDQIAAEVERYSLLINLLSLLISWLYYALMESSAKQATLGKMALGLYVTDTNGGRISFAKASGRFFAKILSALILAIGFIMAAFTERKQGLHDIICSTLVLRRR